MKIEINIIVIIIIIIIIIIIVIISGPRCSYAKNSSLLIIMGCFYM